MRESPHLREIRRLDPVADHQRIVYLDACYEFPFDTTRALELALFRSFAAPSIGNLLASTGEFTGRAQKRYDDTDLLISSFAENGYDSEAGRAAIRQMNQIHRRFEIANDDFLYVLSTLCFEPIRWNARFGWRPLIGIEKEATFLFWRQVGLRMAIRGIPERYDAFERFNVEYEREHFAAGHDGRLVGEATRDLLIRWFPALPHAVGAAAISAVLDEPLLHAMGFRPPAAIVRRLAEGALRARSRVVRHLPPRRKPRLRTTMRRRSYPDGYRIEELGPAKAP